MSFEKEVKELLYKASKIGYENNVSGLLWKLSDANNVTDSLDIEKFKNSPQDFTIVDIRNKSEVKEGKPFANSIEIPLPELRERLKEIHTDKPIVVHCAGGYRSAIGSSILETLVKGQKVFDLGEAVKLMPFRV